jgi:cation/acetate symporter
MNQTPWLGIDNLRFGIIGASVSLVAMVVVSLLTKPESAAVQQMVDDLRIPSGKTIIRHS